MAQKRCTVCQAEKGLSEFYSKINRRPNRKADRTYSSECKPCTRTRGAAWRTAVANAADSIAVPDFATCSRCRTKKPAVAFALNRTKKRGLQHMCLECMRDRKYGLLPGQFEQMLRAQARACAICRTVPDKRLVVDHCHKTGAVRGLLCVGCNSGIGMMRDDIGILARSIEYLSTRGDHV